MGFNPSFGLSAIPTYPTYLARLLVGSFNPSFGLSAIPTKPQPVLTRQVHLRFQSLIRA